MSKSTKPAAKPAAKKSVKKAGTPLRERLGALLTSAPEVRLSIRVKMVIYMSIIFLTMLVILNIFVARNVTAGNEKYINDDLVTQKNNGLIYVKQMLVLNGRDNDEEGFAAIAPALVEEISGATGSPTAAFDTAGEMLAATNSQLRRRRAGQGRSFRFYAQYRRIADARLFFLSRGDRGQDHRVDPHRQRLFHPQ